jgi:carbon storage regulator
MLMMSRRQGETILIGEEIEIVISHIGRSRVKVGIRAPRQLLVVAQELKVVGEENRAAALTPSATVLEALLARLHSGVPAAPRVPGNSGASGPSAAGSSYFLPPVR